MWDYLEQDVRGVMKQHHQSADANVVSTVGETEQEDGGQMVNHLFFEILAKQTGAECSVKQNDHASTVEFKFLQ